MLTILDIHKSYNGTPLLQGVSLSVSAGETLCLLGPSGSGKSTLLRIIAGLDQPEAGQICWEGMDLRRIPVHKRNFSLMFQDYALFPHRTVAENVAFGLRMQRLPRSEIDRQVQVALDQVNLSAFGHRRITDLSGGEQQRVALARALAPAPRMLMLDEPLGALDRALREQLIAELRRTLQKTGIPAIYVTHDQEEAFAISDRMAILHNGKIVQEGEPGVLFQKPNSPWVAGFLGLGSLSNGKVIEINPVRVQTRFGLLTAVGADGQTFEVGEQVTVLVKSSLSVVSSTQDFNLVTGIVRDATFHGENYRVEIDTGVFSLQLDLPAQPAKGENIEIHLPADGIICFKNRQDEG